MIWYYVKLSIQVFQLHGEIWIIQWRYKQMEQMERMKVQTNGAKIQINKIEIWKKIWIHDIKQIDLRLILVKTLMVDLVGWLCKVISIFGWLNM